MANDPAMDIAGAAELLGRASDRLRDVRDMLRKARDVTSWSTDAPRTGA